MHQAHIFAQENSVRFLDELKHIISMPSVSTDPQYKSDVQMTADWLCTKMAEIGFDSVEQVEIEAGNSPLIFGTWMGAGETAPTILIYSHYDVQPASIEERWHTDPFVPTIKEGILYGRGATDSKINVTTQLCAIESILATPEKSPVNIKLLLEGEEESGGQKVKAFCTQYAERISADVCVVSDGPMLSAEQPSLVIGLRGAISLEIQVQGPINDLHSGTFGGTVHNPIQALAEILAQLHDTTGVVTVPGFYDDVILPDRHEREAISGATAYYDEVWHEVVAAPAEWGEEGYTVQEKAGMRPTLDINGIWGGYTGAGMKTVLPGLAWAKISCRLVPNQQPQKILEAIKAHIQSLTPPTVTSRVESFGKGATAVRLPHDSKAMQVARNAFESNWGREALLEMMGSSIPIVSLLSSLPNTGEVIIMGYGHKAGQAHGPNENIHISTIDKGIGTAIDFLLHYGL